MTTPTFNLSLPEAIEALKTEATSGEVSETINDVAPEDAFFLGFSTAVQRLIEITGPDPLEVTVVEIPLSELPERPIV